MAEVIIDLQPWAAALIKAAQDTTKAIERMSATLHEWAMKEDIRAWVEYDKAGAPYGYMRKGLNRWRAEQVAKAWGTTWPTDTA